MTMPVLVTDLQAGDRFNLTLTREARVERVEVVTPSKTAGLEFDDALRGSGAEYVRVYYSTLYPGDKERFQSCKDYPLNQQLHVERAA